MKKFLIFLGVGVAAFQILLNLSLIMRVVSSSEKKSKEVLAVINTSNPNERFIPLGTGYTNSNQWTNVPGLQVAINPSLYKNLQQVLFEVGIFNPNASGTISVQLFNTTTNTIVWSSIVSLNGGASGYIVSGPVTLAPGNNVYQVQMVNTLNAPAQIVQARLRMISK